MSLVFPPLYAIIDADLLKTRLPEMPEGLMHALSFAEMMAESGVELLQYRDKTATSRQLFEVSRAMSAALSKFPSKFPSKPSSGDSFAPRFIVNDRADVALLAGASGVHVGQHDLSVEDARAIVGADRWVGVSTHTLEQVEAADRTSADYIAFGPVFPTATKEKPDPVVGLNLLAGARLRTRKPLVAIGGITLERAAETYRVGADSLAVARDLLASANPRERAKAFLAEAARVGSSRAPELGGH
jgi:thiamine-phosphate pyrophosphorylase